MDITGALAYRSSELCVYSGRALKYRGHRAPLGLLCEAFARTPSAQAPAARGTLRSAFLSLKAGCPLGKSSCSIIGQRAGLGAWAKMRPAHARALSRLAAFSFKLCYLCDKYC